MLSIDFSAIRDAPVLAGIRRGNRADGYRATLGFDPGRDLDRVILAAAGGARLDFMLMLEGRLSRSKLMAAARRRGHALKERSRAGFTLYTEPGSGGASLLFPGPGLMMGVSRGWTAPVLGRLRGEGRSVVDGDRILATSVRVLKEAHSIWMVSRLAPGAGRLLVRQTGWAELESLISLRGSMKADSRLWLDIRLRLGSRRAARSLKRRLGALLKRAKGSGGDLNGALRILDEARLEQDGREVRARVSISARQLLELLPPGSSPK